MTQIDEWPRRRLLLIAVIALLVALCVLLFAYGIRGRFSRSGNGSVSSYALIMYRAPATLSDSELVAAFARQARLRGASGFLVRFMPGVALYPAETVGLPDAKAVVAEVVALYPGLEAVVIVPRAGTSVVGWLDSARGDMVSARPAMNEAGENTWPVIYRVRQR